jgi:3-oxoacyl-[acyl-carrier protein] reductase
MKTDGLKNCLIFSDISEIDSVLISFLAENGYKVAYIGRGDKDALGLSQELMDEILSYNLQPDEFEKIGYAVKDILSKWEKIDLVITNINGLIIREFVSIGHEEIMSGINKYINSLYYLVKALLPSFISRKSGNIIHLGSSLVYKSFSLPISFYMTLKSALFGFTKSLSKEVGRFGIKTNVILSDEIDSAMPEYVKESMKKQRPYNKAGDMNDLGELIKMLDNDNIRISGQIIPLDGGLTDHVI